MFKFKFCILFISISFKLTSFAYANEVINLIIPTEIWVAEVDEEGSENSSDKMKVTIAFIGSKLDDEDVSKNRYPNISKGLSLLTGFEIVDMSAFKKVASDCPEPRKQVFKLEGYKDSKGKIVLSMIKKDSVFNGTLNIFQSANTFEINKINGNIAEMTINFMAYTPSDHPFVSKRIGPIKIKKIQ